MRCDEAVMVGIFRSGSISDGNVPLHTKLYAVRAQEFDALDFDMANDIDWGLEHKSLLYLRDRWGSSAYNQFLIHLDYEHSLSVEAMRAGLQGLEKPGMIKYLYVRR